MNDVRVGEIVGVTLNDRTLPLEAELLYIQLKFQNDRRSELIEDHQQRFDWARLLTTIVTQFVVEKGQLATVGNFGSVLSEMGHCDTTESLLNRFETSAIIVDGDGDQVNHEDIQRYEDIELQRKTAPSAVSILQLLPIEQGQPEGSMRLAIVVTQLLKILTEIGNKPVAIISINGKQRSGKSFLATQFIKYLKFGQGGESGWLDAEMNESFQWRDDFERVTSGIQVWHEPFYVNHNGREIAVVVMDTQGLHDSRTGSQENSLIFGLSVLISSVFIYNERHSGDDSLQFLHSALEFAKFASGGENGRRGQLKFQKLMVLCRDWQAERQYKFGYYEDNVCPPGQMANLKNAFFDVTTRMHRQSRKTREGINKCFEKIGVFALSGPGENRPGIPGFEASPTWNPNFREGIVNLVQLLFSPENVAQSTKTICGEEMTAAELIPFVANFAEKIQSSERSIESRSIFDSTAQLFYNRKMEIAVNSYKQKQVQFLNENSSGVSLEFFDLHNIRLVDEVIATFSEGNALGGEQMKEHYATALKDVLEMEKQAYIYINEANRAAEEHRRRCEVERIEAERREVEFRAEMERLRLENELREETLRREMETARNEHERQVLQLQMETERERHEAQLREAEAERRRQEAIHQAALEKAAMEARMEQQRLQALASEAQLRAQMASGGGGGGRRCTIL